MLGTCLTRDPGAVCVAAQGNTSKNQRPYEDVPKLVRRMRPGWHRTVGNRATICSIVFEKAEESSTAVSNEAQ